MSIDRTVLGLMLRGVLAGRRTLMLGALALLPVVAALFFALAGEIDPVVWWSRIVERLLLPVIVAFVAVVIGAGVVADQREDGTILYLAATPVRRVTLATCALLAAWFAALALIVPSVALTGLIALRGELSVASLLWPIVAVCVAALVYCALGALVAMVARQPVLVAVLYILLWEGTVASWSDTADYLSVSAYARALSSRGLDAAGAGQFGPGTAILVLGLAAAGATALTARRLTRTELP